MATRLVHDMVYEASAAEVAAMLSDKAFREEVCRAMQATSYDVTVEGGVESKRVVIDMEQPTDKVPSFARKLVGETTNVVQTETWRSPSEAEVVVAIPGKPGEMRGTARLVERDGVTTEHVEMEIKVKIPLVAGKIEELLAGLLKSALKAEHRAGQAYLAG